MTHMVLTLDTPGFVSLLFLILVLLCIYKHPWVERRVGPFFELYLFAEDNLNKNYKHPQIQTLEELVNKKEMDTEKWKYKLVDDDPLLHQIKAAKQSLIGFSTILLRVTSFIESLKNLVLWHEPKRTVWFLVFTFFAYCACSVMSFKILFLLISKFFRKSFVINV